MYCEIKKVYNCTEHNVRFKVDKDIEIDTDIVYLVVSLISPVPLLRDDPFVRP